MYGIVEITGHQYMVKAGDVVDVEKLAGDVGSAVELDKVLFVGGKESIVGKPTVSGAVVKAQIVKQDRQRKKVVFVRKPGQYQKKNGHRQHFTSLLITEVADGKGNTEAIDKDSKNAKRFLK